MGGKPRSEPAALARAIRAMVQGMIDGVVETRGADGRVDLARRERFAYVQPMADHVRVGFEHGRALPDVAGLLHGDGSQVRYAIVRTRADASSRGLRMLLAAALFDDDTHGFRDRR